MTGTQTGQGIYEAASLTRVTIEIEHGNLSLRWRETTAVQVQGEGVEATTHGHELRLERREGRWFGAATSPIHIELPLTLGACSVRLGHGDLSLEAASGDLDARVEQGDVRLSAGQAAVKLWVGSGDVAVDELTGPLTVHDGQGDVHLGAIEGALTVQLGRGDIVVRGGHGETRLTTGLGDVQAAERAAGSLTITTGCGDIAVEGGSSGATGIKSGKGDVRCSARLEPGAHAFTSGAGDVAIGIARDLPVRVEAVTGMGGIRSDLPLVSVGQRGPKSHFGRRLVGSIGEGAPRAEITLRTGFGDVHLDYLAEVDAAGRPVPGGAPSPPPIAVASAGAGPLPPAAAPLPPAAPAPPRPSEGGIEAEQRAILEAVAAGTLSPAEAAALLDSLAGHASPDAPAG